MSNTKNSFANESDDLKDKALDAFDEGVANPDAPLPIKAERVEDGGAPDDLEENEIEETSEEKVERERAEAAAARLEKGRAPKETGKPAKAKAGAKPEPVAAVSKDKPAGEEEEEEELTPEQQVAADKKAVDDEVKSLGLKGKTEERFRELVEFKRTHSQAVETIGGSDTVTYLAELGVKSKADIETLYADARDSVEWDRQMADIEATPAQVGQAFGFVAGFNKGLKQFNATGDGTILKQFHDNLIQEATNVAKMLGLTSATFDPLNDPANKDLKDRVESGDLSRADADDKIKLRVLEANRTAQQQRTAQEQQQTTATQAEQQKGLTALQALGASLKAADGEEVFAFRMKSMGPKLQQIRDNNPPSAWSALAELAYLKLPKPVPKKDPPVRVGARTTVLRTDAAIANQVQREAIDPVDAFDMGVEEARARGE